MKAIKFIITIIITYIFLCIGFALFFLHYNIEPQNNRLILLIIGNWFIAYLITINFIHLK